MLLRRRLARARTSIRRRLRGLRYRNSRSEFMLDADPMSELGAELESAVFSGGPTHNFGLIGRLCLIVLLKMGLTPESRVLDVGCGSLRCGFWLIHFLRPGHYYGIEPNREMLQAGLDTLFPADVVTEKSPVFGHGADFEFGQFGVEFDFVLARSVWTHASKRQIATMLDQFVEHSSASAVLVASYLPAGRGRPDYTDDEWVGLSHDSSTTGLVNHDTKWIVSECERRGLYAAPLRFDAVDQVWMRVSRRP